jgi:predicted membrane-bound spermidine synthase
MATSASSVAVTGVKLRSAAPRSVYFAIFTISGFSGLIYESIWSHYLKLFLGHAAYAQSLVLMIYMGGLALGSWLAARYAAKWTAPILFYALVEGVIGLIALVFHPLFTSVSDAFFFSILPSIGNPALGNALKWTAAAALIVPQSVLLGMTFPLLSSGILRRFPDQPGGSLAMLYFTNSIGAAVGVLASGFWLIQWVGLPGTIMTAGLLNVALALVVWTLVKLDPGSDAPPLQPAAASHAQGRGGEALAPLFFFAAAVTGAASFIYEIGWIRMLSLVLGGTTHSFELMLSAFITGLALGGLWIKRRIDRIGNPIRFAGWVQVLMGSAAILTIPLYVRTFDWMAAMLSALQRTDTGYTLFTAFSHSLALIVMVPTTFLAGMTLPLFTYVLLRERNGEQAIGRVYAANTLGAIAGVVFAVHVGLPLLGLKFLIVLGAALDVALGLLLLQRSAPAGDLRGLLQGAIVGACVIGFVAMGVELSPRRLSSGVYRYRTAEMDADNQIIYYGDGKTASITLSTGAGRVTIATNGKPDASIQLDPSRPATVDEITMIMAGALPLAYNPSARRVANIGLGSGLTAHTLLGNPRLEQVDTIEIEAKMAFAAQGFGERVSRTFSDSRSAIHLEDAKTFFSLANHTYDAIVAEPSNPWVSGVASLFSEEFYRSVKNYLAADGVLVQWLQLYEFNDQLMSSVLKALSKHFSDYVVYNTDDNNILIVAKNGPLGAPRFDALFQGELGAELAHVGLRSDADFLVRRTGSKAFLDGVLGNSGVPANSDYFPFLDLRAGQARFREQIANSFRSWSVSPVPILEMLGVSDFRHDLVTPDVTFQRTQMIGKAHYLYDGLVNGSSIGSTQLLPGDTLTSLTLLRRSCDMSTFELSWSAGLHDLALTSLAFLDAPAATGMLDSAVPAACTASASPQLLAWLDLYRAVAARDAAGMAGSAERLLESNSVQDASRIYYVMVAAMLGNVLEGRAAHALQLWEKYRGALGNRETAPDLELLINLAASHYVHGAAR